MSDQQPNVRISLASRPENVALVREAVVGIAESVALGGAVEDVKAAVSEAANNVVMHAYPDGEGPMEVELALAPHELHVVVRDHGVGIGPRLVGPGDDGRGIGLAVIEALTSRMELRAHAPTGLEVSMWFAVPEGRRLEGFGVVAAAPAPAADDGSGLSITVAPAALSAPLAGRVLVALGARAGFSIDRLSDLQLLADALGATLERSLDGTAVTLAAAGGRRRLELHVGPLRGGAAEAVLARAAVAGVGPVIERLVDSVAVASDGVAERLVLVIAEARPGAA